MKLEVRCEAIRTADHRLARSASCFNLVSIRRRNRKVRAVQDSMPAIVIHVEFCKRNLQKTASWTPKTRPTFRSPEAVRSNRIRNIEILTHLCFLVIPWEGVTSLWKLSKLDAAQFLLNQSPSPPPPLTARAFPNCVARFAVCSFTPRISVISLVAAVPAWAADFCQYF